MTPNPEYISPKLTVVKALQAMHDKKFLTLPVCKNDGTVFGVMPVMDLIYRCCGTQGLRSIFNDALNAADDQSEAGLHQSGQSLMKSVNKHLVLLSLLIVLKHLTSEYPRIGQVPNLCQCLMFASFH